MRHSYVVKITLTEKRFSFLTKEENAEAGTFGLVKEIKKWLECRGLTEDSIEVISENHQCD